MYKKYREQQQYCLLCFKGLDSNGSFLRNRIYKDPLCLQCREKFISVPACFEINGVKVYSQYIYEGEVRLALLRYKESLDKLMSGVFLHPYWAYKFKNYCIVLVPSTASAIKKRGFHHLRFIAKASGFKNIAEDTLIHTGEKEQAMKEFADRHSVQSEIKIQNTDFIKNKKVLILDDIVTSGETLNTCINLVKAHTDCVCVITVARSKKWDKESKRLHLPFTGF